MLRDHVYIVLIGLFGCLLAAVPLVWIVMGVL